MTQEEFMEKNPCIAKAVSGKMITQQDLIIQGEFFKTHTFIFKYLRQREVEIIKLRYGLTDGNFYTHHQIGDMYNVSNTRTQQLERKALKKLATDESVKLLMRYNDKSIKNTYIKQMIEKFDYKKLMREEIEHAISAGEIYVIKNIKITAFNIPSTYRSSIRKKLYTRGITNINELLLYLKHNHNLQLFKLGDRTYNSVIFGIAKLIEDGKLEFVSNEIKNNYYFYRDEYLKFLQNNKLNDFEVFSPKEEFIDNDEEDIDVEESRANAIKQAQKIWGDDLDISIGVIDFNLRTDNALRRAKINTIEKLINFYYDNNLSFTSIRWIGAVGQEEVLNELKKLGITLYEDEIYTNVIK